MIDATKDYLTVIDYAIEDCFCAFRKIYDYIENEFCHATPVKLGYRIDNTEILKNKFSLSKREMEKYFEPSS